MPLAADGEYPVLQLTVNPVPPGEFTDGETLAEFVIVNGALQMYAENRNKSHSKHFNTGIF